MHTVRFGVDAAQVAAVAAAINLGIAIECLAPKARLRQADAVLRPKDGSEVQDDQQPVPASQALPDERQNAVLAVRAVHPVKTVHLVVALPERRLRLIKAVEVFDEALGASMIGSLSEQPPVEAGIGVPFVALPEFAAHEEQFL